MLSDFQIVNQEFPWFFRAVAFCIGAVVGSFLNVCIYRIPAGKSIIRPGSTCACGKPIAWRDNIPILSWFILRGRARCCGRPYSFRYPFVEALTGFLFLGAWLAYPPLLALLLMLFISLLICASFIDLDHMEIPDRFSMGAALLGFVLSVFFPSLHGHVESAPIINSMRAGLDSALGLLVGSGIILWIAIVAEKVLAKEAMGFGDVKLMGGIGAFLGWQGAVFAIFGGAVIGSIALALVMLAQNLFPRKLAKSGQQKAGFGQQTPFGPMLAAGAVLYALALKEPADQYFASIASVFAY